MCTRQQFGKALIISQDQAAPGMWPCRTFQDREACLWALQSLGCERVEGPVFETQSRET